MDKSKKWVSVTIVCVVLGLTFLLGSLFTMGRTEGIRDSGIKTGVKNNCIAYDEDLNILVVGTYENKIMAFKGDALLWSHDAASTFSGVAINKTTGQVYAGNEDNHIYIYELSTGTLIRDINTQRRIVSLDVSEDGQKIAIATITGTSKSNILVYDLNGLERLNQSYTIKISGVCFTKDGRNMILANNRGELIKLDLDGTERDSYKTNYSILQLVSEDGYNLVVCKNGSYYELDDNLQLIRNGVVNNTIQATMKSIGTAALNGYILVGTEEGYVFVMNENDEQVYMENIGTAVTSFAPVGNAIYMTGLGDFVKTVYIENIGSINTYRILVNVFRILSILCFALAAVSFIIAVPRLRESSVRLLKSIWRHRMAYIMLAPSVLLMLLFNYRGVGIAFIRAFTDWSTNNNTVAKMSFVGLDNFKRMVTEGYFLMGMKNLILLIVTGIIKVLTVPVLVAWLTFSISGDRRKYIHRFLFVLPVVVPGVIGAMTWLKIYDPSIGLLNQILSVMNLENLQRVWLGDARTAIWAIIFMGFPFVNVMAFLVYYGGFIGIGKEIEESAWVDGATKGDIFWKIQLPLIRPQLGIMVMLTLIGTMQDFNGIYILTGGGPGTATYVPALELYLNVAQFGRYGYACALGVVLFIFTMIVTMLNMKLTKSKE